MIFTRLNIIFLFPVLFVSTYTPAQSDDNIFMLKEIYAALEEKVTSSQQPASFMPDIEWEQVKENSDLSSLSFPSIVKKEWESLLFRELQFHNAPHNTVLVTGIIEGRKSTECEYVSTRFSHSWLFKNGKPVGFKNE